MNIAEYSIRKKIVTWMLIVLCVAGGVFAYFHLARYEDPEYTIKDALVLTTYKGAAPRQVEEEVTDRIEKAIQTMGQIKRIKSISRYGESEITVTIKDQYNKKSLPQVWTELRAKIRDVQRELPPGAGQSLVIDDYGDVYGMLYAVTGAGFSYAELKKQTDLLRRELSLVPGVAKVNITGERQEAIFVNFSQSKMAQMGISVDQIYKTLASQNAINYAGEVRVGDEYIRITPTGSIDSVQAIGSLLVSSQKSKKLVHLDDVATVERSYVEVPTHMVYYDGQPGLMMGISIVSGGNVVKIGEAVAQRMHELQNQIPIGVVIHSVYSQPDIVNQSIKGFMVSLAEALAIVIVVLFLFMGVRSGVIIAAVLLLTVLGTLFVMYFFGIALERISLGALIIALGMLVDNAIVVTEGILIKSQQGIQVLDGARDTVKQTMWPLFGATVVGILAFAAIGLSQDSTGEYTRSLFYVILISLLLSWFLAITVAPLLCHWLLKVKQAETGDTYQGIIFRFYRRFLSGCIKVRWLTVMLMLGLLFLSVYGFQFVKQSFFPDSTTPIFYVDYWRSQGTDIRATATDMLKIENKIRALKEVEKVTSVVGGGAQRFMLVYEPEKKNSSYGQFIIRVKDYRLIPELSKKIKQAILKQFPDSEPKTRFVRLGPGGGAKIEARFSGGNADTLRALATQAESVMLKTPGAEDVRNDWRQKVKVIEPMYSQKQARITGISREALSDALSMTFTGNTVGYYREKDLLIPIISRPPDAERLDINSIEDLPIWSPLLEQTVPVSQLVTHFDTTWQNSLIHRRDRRMTITVSAEPSDEPASVVMSRMKEAIEAIPLPTGYSMEWGGEYENSHDAQTALAQKLPISVIPMILIVILLFGAIRQPLIIWLCVPLSFVGVTAGLLATRLEFGFMALLGFLSLSGMLIKNAIVLIDQIDLEMREGKPLMNAILDSSVSRMRPVMLAAITTVLGMIPLLFDAFFASMAVVIMVGLTFASILTLVVVPVLYFLFFRSQARNAQ